jgi:uncharacterized protein YndB with AHSA1/START domain
MVDIKHYITIKKPASVVYKAVTEQQGLASWWTTDTIAKAEIGFINEFRFGDRYHDKMKIINLVPGKKVLWECIYGHEEWLGTKLIFDLEAKENHTILRFSHGNWREVTDFYAICNTIWGQFLHSLKDYCETGKGRLFMEKK